MYVKQMCDITLRSYFFIFSCQISFWVIVSVGSEPGKRNVRRISYFILFLKGKGNLWSSKSVIDLLPSKYLLFPVAEIQRFR